MTLCYESTCIITMEAVRCRRSFGNVLTKNLEIMSMGDRCKSEPLYA